MHHRIEIDLADMRRHGTIVVAVVVNVDMIKAVRFPDDASVTTTALFGDAIPVGIALRFIATCENAKDARDGLLYTRILATSYFGQLLEIMFTSNTDPNPALKA